MNINNFYLRNSFKMKLKLEARRRQKEKKLSMNMMKSIITIHVSALAVNEKHSWSFLLFEHVDGLRCNVFTFLKHINS